MDFSYILETFVKTLAGIPVTLGIMVVSILLSFFPALFLALGRIYRVKGVTTFSVIYLAFIRSTPWPTPSTPQKRASSKPLSTG